MSIQNEIDLLKIRYIESLSKKPQKSLTEENLIATQKQIDFLDSLWNKINLEKFVSQMDFYTKITGRNIQCIRDLRKSDVSNLILESRRRISITQEQTKLVKQITQDLQEVSKLCKRTIRKYSEISQYDMKRLTRYNPNYNFVSFLQSFKLSCRDIIIETSPYWEYGKQESNYCLDNTLYFLKFNRMLLLDYDSFSLPEVLNKLDKLRHLQIPYLFRIYQTANGYHVFLISHQVDYYNLSIARLMKHLGCDPWYIAFTFKNGFRVRLNRKITRKEPFVRKWIGDYCLADDTGSPLFPDPQCEEWLRLLETYTLLHT
jgi:hypothetical protein